MTRENLPVEGRELREILDAYFEGNSKRAIASHHQRSTRAIDSLLRKIETDYTEDGARESLINKLAGVPPSIAKIHPTRSFDSHQEKEFFRACQRAGRSLGEMSIIFHLKPETVVDWETRIFPRRMRGKYRLAKAFEKYRLAKAFEQHA